MYQGKVVVRGGGRQGGEKVHGDAGEESARRARKRAKAEEKEEKAKELAEADAERAVDGKRPGGATLGGVDVDRTVTGVLASRPTALDVRVERFSMQVNGQQLVDDCDIELNVGRRYGLLGVNGCGKSNLLTALANREVPVPEHVDVFHLREEAEPSDRTALEAVVDHIKLEVERLQKLEASTLATGGPGDERLQPIYERLEELDSAAFEARAAELLYGLGFGREMMQRATKDMSGGWRMRVALARALFAAPALLSAGRAHEPP